ncbi:hypothetical protein AB4K20DRAFT_1927852 [Rhizopus microsporus]
MPRRDFITKPAKIRIAKWQRSSIFICCAVEIYLCAFRLFKLGNFFFSCAEHPIVVCVLLLTKLSSVFRLNYLPFSRQTFTVKKRLYPCHGSKLLSNMHEYCQFNNYEFSWHM